MLWRSLPEWAVRARSIEHTYIICTKPLQAPVDSLKDMLAAQAHLVHQGAVVDRRRPRVIIHDRIEYLCHDDHFASWDVELLHCFAKYDLRFTIRVCVGGVLQGVRITK